MKGKYAARASRSRELDALEERAVTAERERDRLAAELAESGDAAERRITVLRDQVRRLQDQRGAEADPRISDLEEANRRLRTRLNAAEVKAKLASRKDDGSVPVTAVLDVDWNMHRSGPVGGLAVYEEQVAAARRRSREARASVDTEAEYFARPVYVYDTARSSFSVEWDIDAAAAGSAAMRVSIDGPVPESGPTLATVILPLTEVTKLMQALNESTGDAAGDDGDLLGDTDRLKPIGRDLAEDPADE